MARPKQLKNPKKITVIIETEQYNELIGKGITNISEWIRDRIDDYTLISNDLNQLKQEAIQKQIQESEIKLEIETINQKIKEIEANQEKNKHNKELETEIMETIQSVIEHEFLGRGITKDRLNRINRSRISSSQLKKIIHENNIKIIKPSEKITSHIIASESETKKHRHNKPVREVEPFKEVITRFKNDWKRYNQNNSFSDLTAKEYLKLNQDKYRARCTSKNISWADFQRTILKLD